MVNLQLLDYVRQQRATGISDDDIKKVLATQGWSGSDVDDVFVAVKSASGSSASVQGGSVTVSRGRRWLWIVVTVIMILFLLAVGWFFFVFPMLLRNAQTKASNIQDQLQQNRQKINDALNNIDNTSYTPLTFTPPNFIAPVSYSASWKTFNYVSKNKHFPSFSFRYPASLGSAEVDDSGLNAPQDASSTPNIYIVFHDQASDDTNPYDYVRDHALKKIELHFDATQSLENVDPHLSLMENMVRFWEGEGMSPAYYFTIDSFKAAGLRSDFMGTKSTNYEIDIGRNNKPDLFELYVTDGNNGGPSFITDYDTNGLSTADKIAFSISFSKK
jgi:hypothetical protein